ncbi:MAG: peptidoglycan-binding domain-containing protein [Pseudomonadota bacterium]
MALTSDRFKDNARLQSAANNSPTMRWGERGEAVSIVQKAYVDLGHSMPGSTTASGMDGIFGKETYAVTRHFQSKHHLGIDGIIGAQTMGKLDQLFPSTSPPGPTPPGPTPPGPTPPGPTPPGPTPPTPPTPPPTNARFEASAPLNGFDHNATPRWQMVPKDGSKVVRLMGGESLTVVPLNPSICTVHEVERCFTHGGREFVLRGVLAGQTQIAAMHGGVVACRLDVHVKSERVVTMAFHYVSDTGGHATTRAPGGLPALFNYARRILSDQINVTLRQVAVHPSVRVDQDLGEIIVWADGEWDPVVAHRDSSADLNVFFVWEYNTRLRTGDDAEAGTLRAEGNCLMEDNIGYANHAWTLAHEIGHYLGHRGHTARGADLLMSPSRTNNRINKAMTAIMNP